MDTRTDIHRPSAVVPEDYDFVAFDYIGGSDLGAILMLKVEKERFLAHMKQTGGKFSSHEHGGSCYICGAFACYLCTFYHAKSNAYIQTGEDCARKLDMSYGDMNAFRRVIGDAREAQAGKKKAIALLADAGIARAWEISEALKTACNAEQSQFDQTGQSTAQYAPKYEELTINDIVNKLIKYGSISESQVNFVRKLIAKIDERPILEAKRAEERANAKDCPTGRVRITGTVLGLKEVEDNWSRFGGTKCNALIQSVDGFKVYGSRFAMTTPGNGGINKGDTVDFVATIQPSDKDAKFGFFKRPVVYVDKKLEKFLATVAWG